MPESYLGEHIGKLGFGLMRLPATVGSKVIIDAKSIDREKVCAMTDAFLEAGFTYFDTAYVYGGGESEAAARDCLVRRHPRERFQLADKLPVFLADSREKGLELFNTSCVRCEVKYFDFYLLHALGAETARKAENLGLWDLLAELKAQGRIRHMGFSFHDNAQVLDEILTRHPEAEFVQLQINYKDWEDGTVQSRLCYETARKHGKPVIVMEPVKGGSLAAGMIPQVQELLKSADPTAGPASWALRFAASLDGVITVLSGMGTLEQVRENTALMAGFKPLTPEEQAVLKKAAALLDDARAIACTECRYCVDECPQKICIPEIFRAYNDRVVYQNDVGAIRTYGQAVEGGAGRPADCIACGSCERRCPQKLPIAENMKKAAELFQDVQLD